MKLLMADEFESESGVLFSLIGKFRRVTPSWNLQHPEQGERLWSFSETLVRSALAADGKAVSG